MTSHTVRWALTAMAVISAIGCKQVTNHTYCETSAACTDLTKPVCNADKRCVAGTIDGDMLVINDDMPAPDLKMGDADMTVVNPDMMPPADLRPMCETSSECGAAKPICGGEGTCRTCGSASDDPVCMARSQKRCVVSTGLCGACNPATTPKQNADCTGATTPICDATGACTKCTTHAQCDSGVCLATGACAAATDVAYVDRSNDGCIDGMKHDSAPPNFPYCQISAAITLSEKSMVKVAAATDPYDGFAVGNLAGTFTIYGPGTSIAPNARIGGSPGDPAVTLLMDKNATADLSVTFDGMELGGTQAAPAGNSILCTNNKTGHSLTIGLVNSLLRYNSSDGISSTKCDIFLSGTTISQSDVGLNATGGSITVRRSTIVNNLSSGIKANLDNYVIENSLFAKNTGAGITFDGTLPLAGSSISFVTIARNGVSGSEGGINCGSLSGSNNRQITNSIVALNTTSDSTPSQFNGRCAFVSVVAGATETSTAPGLTNTTPMFVNSLPGNLEPDTLRAGFSLDPTDTVAKDKLEDSSSFPGLDLFGTARPQGAKFDIGAHEVIQN